MTNEQILKKARRNKYRKIQQRRNADSRMFAQECNVNGICRLYEKIVDMLYPKEAQFMKEFHGEMPKNTIPFKKIMTTGTSK